MSLEKPAVFTKLQIPVDKNKAMAMVAHFGLSECRLQNTAHRRNARHNPGIAKTGNMMPIIAEDMLSWSNSEPTRNASPISSIPPMRSAHRTRLKNNHQSIKMIPRAIDPSTPTIIAPGIITGTTNRSTHWSATMVTPGHSRRLEAEFDDSERFLDMSYLLERFSTPIFSYGTIDSSITQTKPSSCREIQNLKLTTALRGRSSPNFLVSSGRARASLLCRPKF